MLVPADSQIESAVDSLKQLTQDRPSLVAAQSQELHEALGAQSEDFIKGYNLGLQTARVILATSPELILHGVKADSLL